MKHIALLVMLLLLIIPTVFAASVSLNTKYISIDDSGAIVGNSYTALFNIEISNKTNCSSGDVLDSATVHYTIKDASGNVAKDDTFTKDSIKCHSYSNTGSWTPSLSGTHEICGTITASTVENYNSSLCYSVAVTGASAGNATNTTDNNATYTSAAESPSAPATTPSAPASAPYSPPKYCDISVDIDANPEIDMKSENKNFSITVNEPECSPTDVIVSIWTKDVDGRIVSSESFIDKITCYKTIERSLGNLKNGTYVLKIYAEPTSCVDRQIKNNIVSAMFAVVSSFSENKDYIRITNPKAGTVFAFGSEINLSMELYSEMPGIVSVSIASVNQTLLNRSLRKPSGLANMELVLRIPENCDNTFRQGAYRLNAVLKTEREIKKSVSIELNNSGCKNKETGGGITGMSAGNERSGGILDAILSFFAGIFGLFH